MTKIGATPEPQQPQERHVQQQQQEKQNPSVFAEYNDKDGKVDTQDVSYTTNQTSENITKFLQINKGKEWTNSLKFQIDNLIKTFNFECAQQAMQNSFNNFAQNARDEFEDFVNGAKKKFEQFSQPAIQGKMHKVEKEVGHLVPILNDDGSSYQIDFKNKTIAKYSPEGELIGKRAMTDEEKAMKAQDLINSVQNNPDVVKTEKPEKAEVPPAPVETEQVDEAKDAAPVNSPENSVAPKDTRTINRDGVNISYSFTEKEDGSYSYEYNGGVQAFRNSTVRAFRKGLSAGPDVKCTVEESSEGYTFRGIFAKTYNILDRKIDNIAKTLAVKTAIYQDLQTRQTNGETLSKFEQKFMDDYLKSLTEFGLQMNENGELEDIPVKKGRRR